MKRKSIVSKKSRRGKRKSLQVKKSLKRKSLKTKCNQSLRLKIRKNISGFRRKKFKSPKQAIAVAYNQMRKSHPKCNRFYH